MSKTQDIAKTICTLLQNGPVLKRDVLRHVVQENRVTVQGVYKELRRLIKNSTLLLHNNTLSLNLMYIQKELEKWQRTRERYEDIEQNNQEFSKLKEGKSMTVKFKDLKSLDMYWVHISVLISTYKKDMPSYALIPHDWFFYATQDTDSFWSKSEKERSRILITHPTELDKSISRQRIKLGYKVTTNENPLHQEQNVYINLIGGYICKVTMSPEISKQIDLISNTYQKMRDIPKDQIQKLLITQSTLSIKITQDFKKYEKLIKKCEKWFV